MQIADVASEFVAPVVLRGCLPVAEALNGCNGSLRRLDASASDNAAAPSVLTNPALATLLQSGVPLLKAMDIVKNVLDNARLSKVIEEADRKSVV